MVLQIVAPLVASVDAAVTLKQDLCVSPMAPSFSMGLLPMQSFPGEKPDIDCIWQ